MHFRLLTALGHHEWTAQVEKFPALYFLQDRVLREKTAFVLTHINLCEIQEDSNVLNLKGLQQKLCGQGIVCFRSQFYKHDTQGPRASDNTIQIFMKIVEGKAKKGSG